MEVLPPAYDNAVEDAGARKGRIRSLYTVHACMMIFSFGYSIVLTGVLPYLRRLTSMGEDSLIELFGWMVAINPIGQMIFSPVLGLTVRHHSSDPHYSVHINQVTVSAPRSKYR